MRFDERHSACILVDCLERDGLKAWYVDLLHSIVLKYLLSACQNVLNVVKLAVALVWQVELT